MKKSLKFYRVSIHVLCCYMDLNTDRKRNAHARRLETSEILSQGEVAGHRMTINSVKISEKNWE
jgi:hypothetical protein